ncbi:MAG: hypothetical protein QM664_02695 [Flavihumibacter sp.]
MKKKIYRRLAACVICLLAAATGISGDQTKSSCLPPKADPVLTAEKALPPATDLPASALLLLMQS